MRTLALLCLTACLAFAHPNHQLEIISTSPPKDLADDVFPLGNGLLGALAMTGVEEDIFLLSTLQGGQVLPLGKLRLRTGHQEAQARTFTRRLDLQTATAEVSYRHGTTRYRREYFVSHPDRVMVARWRSLGKSSESMRLAWEASQEMAWTFDASKHRLMGKAKDQEVALEIHSKDGQVTWHNGELRMEATSDLVWFLAVGDTSAILDKLADSQMTPLIQRHVEDYQALFHAMYMTIEGPMQTSLTTAKRLERYRVSPAEDLGLEELYFQFGRYLLISSTRGSTPHPRDGIWSFPESETTHAGQEPSVAAWVAAAQLTNLAPLGLPALKDQDAPAPPTSAETAYETLKKRLAEGSRGNLISRKRGPWENVESVVLLSQMLLEEDKDLLRFLPALPKAWPDGNVQGATTLSGKYEVAFAWLNGKFIEGYLTSLQGGECQLAVGLTVEVFRGEGETPTETRKVGADAISFPMTKGEQVTIRAKAGG